MWLFLGLTWLLQAELRSLRGRVEALAFGGTEVQLGPQNGKCDWVPAGPEFDCSLSFRCRSLFFALSTCS